MRGLEFLILSTVFTLLSCASQPPREQTAPEPARYAEEQFQKLADEERRTAAQQPAASSNEQAQRSQIPPLTTGASPDAAPPSRSPVSTGQDQDTEFLVAVGRGDLKKRPLVCERVADSVARMELAKQIRVLVKERAIDRVRERSGQPLEQDIEIVREELTNELLQEVKIVGRSVNQAAGTCSSTAAMPKSRIAPQAVTNTDTTPTMP
jgi:hypothetical protein